MNNDSYKEFIPLLVPKMPSPQDLMPYLERMHTARQYTNFGPLVRELEVAFCKNFALSRNQITTVANATLGLELVLQALDLPPRSHVLLPSFTFVATATAVLRAGHIPVLGDVDAETWLLTPDIARSACAQIRIDAVLPVATFGMPHDMHAWNLFEQETGIPVVIDAAAAYGSQWLDGSQGTLVFSLHTTKSLPAGEGGVVVSSRSDLVSRVRQLSNFGINLDPSANVPLGSLSDLGSNAKMSEYHAAIGLASLQQWESNASKRRSLHNELVERLNKASGAGISWQASGIRGGVMAPSLLCARLPNAAIRESLEQLCKMENISTRRWYQPLLHDMPILQKACLKLDIPNAVVLAKTILGFPFFLGLDAVQIVRMESTVRKVFNMHL